MGDINESGCTDSVSSIEERQCTGHDFNGQKCKKKVSLKHIKRGTRTDCNAIIKLKENELKQCGYVYENGRICCETNLTYHGHCHNQSCDGCELWDGQCPICDPH